MESTKHPEPRTKSEPANMTGGALPKTDARYWQQHLTHRKYTNLARSTSGNEYSARVAHDGVSHFFPLGSEDEAPAAARALEIYLLVTNQGWREVFERFPREITVAIFWAASPVACTYTTVFTEVNSPVPEATDRRAIQKNSRTVFIIEPEEGVQNALVLWINRQPGFRCRRAFASAKAALDQIRRNAPDLLLINRNLPDLAGGDCAGRLQTRFATLPIFNFGIYEESDQIFHSLTGVNAGYFLRRRPPLEMFDPVGAARHEKTFSLESIAHHIRKYFRSLFDVPPPRGEFQTFENLTQREHEIMTCLSRGYQDKKIADALKISVWTVHGHLKNVFEKLRVRTRTEAVIKYLQK